MKFSGKISDKFFGKNLSRRNWPVKVIIHEGYLYIYGCGLSQVFDSQLYKPGCRGLVR
ncbi:hypothetical protein FHR54_003511 [Xanthomonas arboricola]